jgi:hypothetical protein
MPVKNRKIRSMSDVPQKMARLLVSDPLHIPDEPLPCITGIAEPADPGLDRDFTID